MSKMNQLKKTHLNTSKRIGRGYGSGKGGHTSTRGQKGQGSRKSGGVPLWFEGGQLPMTKKMPMIRGKSRLKVVRPVMEINLGDLNKIEAEKITVETLKLNKLVGARCARAKVIATGEIKKPVHLEGIQATAAAKKAIKAVGGSVN